jgi:hypothetical protein
MYKRKEIIKNVEPLLVTIPQVAAMSGFVQNEIYDLIS